MASDYKTIRVENEIKYGTDIPRIGKMLLADRYGERTHFIFELLQNAEDALKRRLNWNGNRSVRFQLGDTQLRVSHYGEPFNEADVRGICGIAESTKGITAIGRFGIGFKSVYAYTDRPSIHSGTENFCVESFVWPMEAPDLDRVDDETVINIPLKPNISDNHNEIAEGLQRLGPGALLFLRQIEEIQWEVQGGASGSYIRIQPENLDDKVRRIKIIGQEQGKPDLEQTWLIFSKSVRNLKNEEVGQVEIAFSVVSEEKDSRIRVRRVSQSPLVAYFPTVLETNLGFLIQGPYRTTPSRDNVPADDDWNRHCIKETSALLAEALRWLRDSELLDTSILQCLPLDPAKFDEKSMFAPLFTVSKESLLRESLLPSSNGSYISASRSRLGRSSELRELLNPKQLATLFGENEELYWLTDKISVDRTPDLHRYIINQLKVAEIRPEVFVDRLDKDFLEDQSDNWILDLYQFLNGKKTLKWYFNDLPLIRLKDGSHVQVKYEDQPQAFLPSANTTEFPTVRSEVCGTDEAMEFLRSLGLTEPDPVDDVVRNILPNYCQTKVDVDEVKYESDIERILTAFRTDSKVLRDKLVTALSESPFVRSIEMGDNRACFSKPDEVYLATERFKALFHGVPDILLVDDNYSCLKGEEIRDLLEACGATRHLKPIKFKPEFSFKKLSGMRADAGIVGITYELLLQDYEIYGLEEILVHMKEIDSEMCRHRATLLWEALLDLERSGTKVFSGTYSWQFYTPKQTTFVAAFVQLLNSTNWIPDDKGNLQKPEAIKFDSLEWKSNPYLQSIIIFKPQLIDRLAAETGFEPGTLDLLKQLDLTTLLKLRQRLGLKEEVKENEKGLGSEAADDADATEHFGSKEIFQKSTIPELKSQDTITNEPSNRERGEADKKRLDSKAVSETESMDSATKESTESMSSDTGRSHFVSYVATHPTEEARDPDGLDQKARMALEAKAIDFILTREPEWLRTETNNPGFDLYKTEEDKNITERCEVKSMASDLLNHPVGLSRTQFECAQEHGERFWLYIVENTGKSNARIIRIKDPAGKSQTFTFDSGWINAAEPDEVE